MLKKNYVSVIDLGDDLLLRVYYAMQLSIVDITDLQLFTNIELFRQGWMLRGTKKKQRIYLKWVMCF